jgi:uncharacterized repeat protein (TIGR03809 family)
MSVHQPPPSLDGVAHKWRALAERRRAHFVDMFTSGRWKRYYTEQQFLQLVREAILQCERWAQIAPPPPDASTLTGDRAPASDPSAAAVGDATAAVEEPALAILHRPAA